MKFLLGLLLNNLVYKVVALLVAFVLWAGVQGASTQDISRDLPIELLNPPEELVLIERSHLEINVRLKGSRAALLAAKRELTNYPLSLEGLEEGETTFPIAEPNLLTTFLEVPRGAQIVARVPATVVVRAEPVRRKKVPVRADVRGELPEGYSLTEVTVLPQEVVLAGARSSIRRVREVMTERIEISELVETTTQELSLAPLGDAHLWRAEEDQAPLRVRVVIEPPPAESEAEADGAGTPEGEVEAGA